MTGGWWDGPEPAGHRMLGPYFRFLKRELLPLALVATLADTLGTAVIFWAEPAAHLIEANPVARGLYPQLGPFSPLANAPLEFAGDVALAAWLALASYLIWYALSGSASWRWPALAFASFPFFAVATWLTGGWALLLFSPFMSAVVVASLLSLFLSEARGRWAWV